MPYSTLGEYSGTADKNSFIVVHDFFDTCDASIIPFKQIVARHHGCQVLCFNYPGQANTVWPRPPPADRRNGAIEPVLNNDWIADRLHELLQHVILSRDLTITGAAIHIVGIGNGTCIAAAFLQRWGAHPSYEGCIRALVSLNGFLSPDPQLAAILHSGMHDK